MVLPESCPIITREFRQSILSQLQSAATASWTEFSSPQLGLAAPETWAVVCENEPLYYNVRPNEKWLSLVYFCQKS